MLKLNNFLFVYDVGYKNKSQVYLDRIFVG